MKTKKEIQREYIELQDLINIITTTAKLLDYKISKIRVRKLTIIKTQAKTLPLILITLKANQHGVKLITEIRGLKTTLEQQPHQEKINHLKSLLQKL